MPGVFFRTQIIFHLFDGRMDLKISPMKIIRVLGERAGLAISQHGYHISTFSDFGAEFFGIAHECENIVGQWRYYKKRKLLSSAGMIDSCFIVPSIMVSFGRVLPKVIMMKKTGKIDYTFHKSFYLSNGTERMPPSMSTCYRSELFAKPWSLLQSLNITTY